MKMTVKVGPSVGMPLVAVENARVVHCSHTAPPEVPNCILDEVLWEPAGRFPSFPIEIGIELDEGRLIHLSCVSITCHAFKIPQRVHVYAGVGSSYSDAAFRRVGFFVFSRNYETYLAAQQTARIDTESAATHLRLVFSNPSRNRENHMCTIAIQSIRMFSKPPPRPPPPRTIFLYPELETPPSPETVIESPVPNHQWVAMEDSFASMAAKRGGRSRLLVEQSAMSLPGANFEDQESTFQVPDLYRSLGERIAHQFLKGKSWKERVEAIESACEFLDAKKGFAKAGAPLHELEMFESCAFMFRMAALSNVLKVQMASRRLLICSLGRYAKTLPRSEVDPVWDEIIMPPLLKHMGDRNERRRGWVRGVVDEAVQEDLVSADYIVRQALRTDPTSSHSLTIVTVLHLISSLADTRKLKDEDIIRDAARFMAKAHHHKSDEVKREAARAVNAHMLKHYGPLVKDALEAAGELAPFNRERSIRMDNRRAVSEAAKRVREHMNSAAPV